MTNNSKTRIIKMTTDKIYINPKEYLLMSSSNFPPKGDFSFNSHIDIYWEVEVSSFSKKSLVEFRVVDYNPKDISSFFFNQKLKYKISVIHFVDIDWEKLEPLLSSYKKIAFKGWVINYSTEHIPTEHIKETSKLDNNIDNHNKVQEESKFQEEQEENDQKDTVEIKVPFKSKIKFKDAFFREGGITINSFKVDNGSKFKLPLKIENSNILPEFDNIKYYFYKVFKKRTFNVTGVIVLVDGRAIRTEQLHSDEIEMIDSSIVDKVRKVQILEIPKIIPKEKSEKKLFTPKEIYDIIKNKHNNSNIYLGPEKEIVETIISYNSNPKNKKQLMFISGTKQNNYDKIRFTMRPKFGFLFSIEGENKKHYCWELLNSHATYIWSFNKDLDTNEQINLIESAINIIIEKGRNEYKQIKKSGKLDCPADFNVIIHRGQKISEEDRFKNWKNKFASITK